MGDARNKLKRDGEAYRQWCKRTEERLKALLATGADPICQCGRMTWYSSPKMSFVAGTRRGDVFYCPGCEPPRLKEYCQDLERMYGEQGFHSRADMKQLALFADGILDEQRPMVKPPQRRRKR